MEHTDMYDILFLGQMMKDRIILQDETIAATGGAAYYAGLAAQRLGARVAVVTKLAKADDALLDEFRETGVTVFPAYNEVTSSIELRYAAAQPDKRTATFPTRAAPFSSAEIPPARAKIIHLCPLLRGEISSEFIYLLRQRTALLSLDAQGFMRGSTVSGEMVMSDWEEKIQELAYVDILKVDDAEAHLLTGCADRRQAIAQLAAYGPQEVVMTYKDGVLVYAEGQYHEALFTSRSFKGRTGRGDTTMGAYLSRRLGYPPQESCRFAAALVSIKMEEHGPFRKELRDVEARLREATPL